MLFLSRVIMLISGFTLYVSSASCAAQNVKAGEPDQPSIKVASMEIPYAYTQDGTGVYNTILDKLTEGYTGAIETSFYPSARFTRTMASRAVDCDYIGTDQINRWEAHGIAATELEFIGPVNTLYVVVYLPKDAPDVSTIDEVKKLNIASDVNLLDLIHEKGIKEVFALQSQIQMLNLLATERIGGLIGYDFDLDFLSKKLGFADKMKKASIRLHAINDGIVCFKTERTAIFRAHLRQKLSKIKKDGWLTHALKDYK